jgi:glycosyltransferase involved in cell wall biosynthesis
MFNPCIIIPVYDHEKPLPGIVDRLEPYGIPCLLVDDGSRESCAAVMRGLAGRHPWVRYLRHEANRGKGGALKTGLLAARQQGYSHAVQIDADGQHDLGDLGRFLDVARANPQAVVIGQAIFDDSIPKVRFYARYLTHACVWINTLSFHIRDAMCGFRVYPVDTCVRLIETASLGDRMEFDVEILIRLYWLDIPVISIPTRVVYPQDGVSHFRMWDDNTRLTLLQIRMFFGLLWRLPGLLLKAVR